MQFRWSAWRGRLHAPPHWLGALTPAEMQKVDDALRSRLGLWICSPVTFHQSPVTASARPSPRSSGCWPLPRPPFGLPAVSTGSKARSLPRGGRRCRSARFPAPGKTPGMSRRLNAHAGAQFERIIVVPRRAPQHPEPRRFPAVEPLLLHRRHEASGPKQNLVFAQKNFTACGAAHRPPRKPSGPRKKVRGRKHASDQKPPAHNGSRGCHYDPRDDCVRETKSAA